ADRPLAYHPRNIIVAGAGSRATVVEVHAPAAADAIYWTQPVTDVVVDAGAELRHYKCQQEGGKAYHVAATTVRIAEDGRYDSFALAAGAALARNEITVSLDGPGASCRLAGGYLGRAR